MPNPSNHGGQFPVRHKKFSLRVATALAIFAITMFGSQAWAAPNETVLYSFAGGNDGSSPLAGLIFDKAGNLYGTTLGGGTVTNCTLGCGVVFELTPAVGGGWTEKVLHAFTGGRDGSQPQAGLIFDASGNLYGTTSGGGAYGAGTVFELKPKAGGSWAEKVLHNFGNGKDGAAPYASVIFDTSGNLYGTTYKGGAYGDGTAFQLVPVGSGWKEKVLHSFGKGKDGAEPVGSMVFDATGSLYGTTQRGGANKSQGTVFELTSSTDGGWKETVLHSFGKFDRDVKDGGFPATNLIFDTSGNLYGTTTWGGSRYSSRGSGIVFELSPNAGGWTETVVWYFARPVGKYPEGNLIFDASGNLYGTTAAGGSNAEGTTFELTPAGGGRWTETVLHDFKGKDGGYPEAGLILDTAGNLYGTTSEGGAYKQGTVFKITP
jgi:uncharacterized repeat protein (TIGR03803 family)